MIPMALPAPAPDALAHSERLRAHIADVIRAEGGAIPFHRYMELAMYAPGLGYYSAGATKFGEAGDFVTAPELGSLFARCVANATAKVIKALGEGADWVELGAGSGAFAVAVLTRLDELGQVPRRYRILEPSADLRQRQRERIASRLAPALAARVEWLDGIPDDRWNGVLFANEVLDALPVTRFVMREREVYEEYVALDADGQLHSVDRPADAMLRQAVARIERDRNAAFPNGYRSEVLVQLPWWIQAVCGTLGSGLALFFDYGYPRREFYLADRRQGTLICHYRHRAHSNPFHLPGLCDITSFVDFTAVAEAGAGGGMELAGFCSQASFLFGSGIEQELAAASLDERAGRARNEEARKLLLPGEMGERFKAIGLQRGIDLSALFPVGDLSARL